MTNIPTVQNNPGDLKSNGQIATYSSPEEGEAALYNDLTAKMTGKSVTGLNGNSSLVDFAKTYAPDSDGNNSLQYAANLANKLHVSPDTKIGTLLPRIDDFASAIAGNEGYQGSMNGSNNSSSPVASASIGNATSAAPESTLQKAGDVAGAVGNFLFPAVKDLYNDARGQNTGANTKTALQQVGDTALSVLPLIPGLGEAGEAARGAEVAGEGAADVAPGLLSKIAGSTVTKGAATGYGAGVGSNLSQGQSLGQSFAPNINTVAGGLLGGATPIALKGLSAVTKGLAGVGPQILNALKDSGISIDEYNKYINAAKNRATDLRAPAPLELAANQLDKASAKIDQNLSQAGKAVGAAKSTLGGVSIPDISPVADAFQKRVATDYGLQLAQDPNGIIHAIPAPNRTPSISQTEIARIKSVAQDLVDLQGSTAQHGTDVISKLDNSINYAKGANGQGFDPIEGLLHSVRSGIDDSVRSVAPDLAAANDRASSLYNLKNEVTKMAGGTNQRGELLMKRIFSGDKSGDVQDLFNKIKGETGIDLVNHAVLAKHAIDVAGDSSQKSLLQQMIEGGSSIAKGPIAALLHVGQNVAKKTIANPETIGRQVVTGKAGLLKSAVNRLGTKAVIEGSRGVSSVANSLGLSN